MTASAFDDIRDLIERLPPPNAEAAEALRARAGEGAGDLAAQAAWLAAWSGKANPAIRRPLVAVFAGAHGIASHGVSARPASATQAAVDACARGEAPINRLCQEFDLGLKVFDLALELPTADFTAAPALDEKACAATMAFGMEPLADGTDLLCLGAFGVGGSTAAAALLCALHGGEPADWNTPASSLLDTRRTATITAAMAFHHGQLDDPLHVLRRLGGREFAAIAGAIIAARYQSVPVILDGITALAAAAILDRARPGAVAHCMLAAPLATARLNETAVAMSMTAVLGKSVAGQSHQPLDGALAIAQLKGAAAVMR